MAAVFLAGTPLSSQAALELPKGQLPRTAEIALRRSVPAFNADVKEIQDRLEVIHVCGRHSSASIHEGRTLYKCSHYIEQE